jgi:hypothetical protein
MWATDAAYLNDPSETHYGRRLLRNTWAEFKREVTLSPGEQEFFETLVDLWDAEWHEMYSTYVACFSQDANVLSQWRAYGQPGTGYSLGFDSAKLMEYATGFSLLKVEYQPNVQRETISKVFRYLTEHMRETGTLSDDWIELFYSVFKDEMLSLIVSLKNEAFHEEREWRLVKLQSAATPASDLGFRTVRGMIVPYLPISTRSASDIGSLATVTVGPGPEAVNAEKSIKQLLAKSGHVRTGVNRSNVPYRF